MKKIASVLLCALLSVAAFAGNEFSLAGEWSLSQAGGSIADIPAQIPGDVHSALFDAGLIEDPYFADGEMKNLWVGREDWVFSRTFTLDESFLNHKAIYLRAEDVDIFCDITINGQKVGSTTNRFRRWEWDVKPLLKAGENTIEGYFHSAEIKTEELSKQYAEPYPMSPVGLVPDINLIRKPACHGGWDWGPCQMVTGFAGTLCLIPTDVARIDYVMCDQDHSNPAKCKVTVNTVVTSPEGGKARYEVTFDGRTKSRRVKLAAGQNTVSRTITVRNPQLWWPNGMGEQYRYDLQVKVAESSLGKKIGLRTVEVRNEADTVYGKPGISMAFKVNGREFFAKGADWVPCELFEARMTYGRYADILSSAAAANMNMLRHWGGGMFEHEDYYNICDSLGLMLWHDFMFSCAVYPSDDAFLNEIDAELNHQLRRLRDHCSIAMWCGDNECVGALGWFPETRANRDFYLASLDTIVKLRGRICAEVDPSRVYWPSSPCAGPGDYQTDNWKEDTKGDMHLWSISKFSQPLANYYGVRPRFCSEYGHSALTSYASALRYCSEGQAQVFSPEMDLHTKEVTEGLRGNQIIQNRLALHFDVDAKDAGEFFYLSQVEQAMGLKTASEYWRTLEPNCMGTIFWQLNDIWPGTSWSSIEYDGKWKMSNYHAKRFFGAEVVSATPTEDGTGLDIWAINDTHADKAYSVVVRIWNFDGQVVSETTYPVEVTDGISQKVATLPLDAFGTAEERAGRFLELNLQNEDGSRAAYNWWMFGEFKDSPLAEACVTCRTRQEDGRWYVDLTTDAPAFFVWLSMPDIKGEFSDNSFILYPGSPVTVEFIPREDAQFEAFSAALTEKHITK